MTTRGDADSVIEVLSEVETDPESEDSMIAYMTIWIVRTVLVAENMMMGLKKMKMTILMMRVRKI